MTKADIERLIADDESGRKEPFDLLAVAEAKPNIGR